MGAPAWVAELGVAGTWMVALIALFGEKIRGLMNRPKLTIELFRPGGDLEIQMLRWPEDGKWKERTREARFYRLRVTNARRTSVASDVQVMIEAIERQGPDGTPLLDYSGPIPLEWQHSAAFPTARTIGAPAIVDFLAVTEEKTLKLRTTIAPNRYSADYGRAALLWFTIIARGRESDSKPLRVKVAWDGEWDRGEAEMKRHLTMTVESP